ncbi:hypothetical protein ACO0LB_06870 [Undibacterium sp. SXout7W]
MHPSLISFLLVLAVEAITVVANYLKDCLMQNMGRSEGSFRKNDDGDFA